MPETEKMDSEFALKSVEITTKTGGRFKVENEACILICLGGNAVQKVGDSIKNITTGDVCVLFPALKYEYREMENFRVCVIKFNYENLLIEAETLKNLEGFRLLFVYESYLASGGETVISHTLNKDMLKNIEPLLIILEEEFTGKKEEFETTSKHIFLSLVSIICRYCARKNKIPSGTSVELIIGVASYMEANYSEPVKLEDLAALTHYSCRHFTRLFQEHFHTSPMVYLNNIRMYKASNMLKKTSLSIEEVAHRSGFDDSGHFCRQFKRHYGITPKQCRKQNAENA